MSSIFDDSEIQRNALTLAEQMGGRRGALLQSLLPCAGWQVTEPRFVQRVFLDAIDGTPSQLERQQAAQMARELSSCGMFWESGLRAIGVTWPLLWKFYGKRCLVALEQAITADVPFARQHGAFTDAQTWREGMIFPREADAVIMGNNTAAWARGMAAFQHLGTVALWADGLAHFVDGGQPGIAMRTRAFVEVWTGSKGGQRTGELWLSNVDPATGAVPLLADGRPQKGRRVYGWISPLPLPYSTPRPPDGENAYPDERLNG
jgi:hypothetical protein